MCIKRFLLCVFCNFAVAMRKSLLLFFLLISLCCVADNVTRIVWTQNGVKVKPRKVDGVAITCDKGYVVIVNTDTTYEHIFELSGRCDDGGLTYCGDKKVTFMFSGIQLASKVGSPMSIKCGKRVAIKLMEGMHNELTDSPDTLHKGVLSCKGHLEISGAGSLTINARGGHAINAKEHVLLKKNLGSIYINATGDGCKGIRTHEDFIMRGGDVKVTTSGNYVAEDTTAEFPPMPFDMDFDMEGFDDFDMRPPFSEDMVMDFMDQFRDMFAQDIPMPDSTMMQRFAEGGIPPLFQSLEGDSLFMQRFVDGAFPPTFQPFGGDSMMMGPPGGGPMRSRYIGTTKGIKAQGSIVVEGGTLEVVTSTPGAEGLEGKSGVVFSGGNVSVSAYDDAINSNGKIIFMGDARVRAVSTHNDAVDCNAWGDGAITISGGHTEVFSAIGPPEEGFDSDQWAIVIDGGEAFSVGSGMGPYPSLPNGRSAAQPYLLFQNLRVNVGDVLSVWEKGGDQVISVTSPVANPLNHSLVTSPALKKGSTYVLKQNGEEVQERTLSD